ncbi:hypothetical protein ACOMHN_012982 [Nucella lapillus]
MAERRVQMHQGRRERRRDGDGDGELKRRSRSEGPSAGRRLTQSMDVSSASNNTNSANRRANQHGDNNSSFERRGIKADGDSPWVLMTAGDPSTQTPQGRTRTRTRIGSSGPRNPLIVRKVKKSKAEKRNDNSNSSGYSQLGQRNTNRESWVYLAPEGTPLPAGQEQPTKGDGGSNSGSLKNKYQKLEEMRKKRIDIAMTSDEENTPESRISRLRQRALQGALGTPTKADSSRAIVSDHNSWGRSGPRAGSAVMSDQGTRPAANPPVNHYSRQSVVAQPQAYRSGVVVSGQPANRGVQPLAGHQAGSARQSGVTVTSQPGVVYSKTSQPSNQFPAPVRQGFVRPFTDTVPTDAASPSNLASRQQFYTIPEPHVGSRLVHNSSPEVHVRRFKPAVRIPSADSIYDGVQDNEPIRPMAANRSVVPGQRVYAQVNPPSQDVMEVHRGTAMQYQPPANQRQSGVPKFNEVVELRLKSTRVIDRPLSQTFKDPRYSHSLRRREEGGCHSEDSLDELIESNMQYLENEEMKQGGSKKSLVPVSRSSSLPDPRKSAALARKPQVTVSGQQSARATVQLPAPVQNKSELHFRVPLSPQNPARPMPKIHIAEENQWSDSSQLGTVNSFTFGVVPRVERKHSYDSRTHLSRPTSEHYDRDEVSKSDTHLNAAVVQPTYRGALLHPNNVPGRGYVSDQNLTVEQTQGMFSDVEYDIEVSERVKKWETFMKKPDFGAGGDGKKPMMLTPIEERTEGDRDSLMMPSEIRKSLRMAQQTRPSADPPSHDQQLSLVSMKPANSDPTLYMAADARVLSKETNLHRFFQVVQDPTTGLPTGPHLSQSTSAIYIDVPNPGPQVYSQSSTLYQPGGLMSPDELRQHMLANQRSRSEATKSSAAPQLALAYDEGESPELPDRLQRLSRYQDEIDEMTSVKHQSVSNLRRRFDEVGKMTSEEESRPDSRVAKVSPTQKDAGDANWSQMISGLENRIRDMEVWSPNMESTQGNVVSIERVKARTLQTIPFSEDPFWKEIEEMTTFDPNSLGGHLSVSEEIIKPVTTQTVEEQPHSSTLPTHPRLHSAMTMKERMQRSKSLYTPNITPLTINVEPYSGGKTSSLERGSSTDKYSGTSALDEVLEDIRTSLERKPLSPKRKTVVESSDSLRSSPGHSQTSEILRARAERARAPIRQTESWDNVPSGHTRGHFNQPVSITLSSSAKPAPPAAAVTGMTAGHYHLDPFLLKQKLLSTGLVEEDCKPEPPARCRVPGKTLMSTSLALSKPVAVAPPQAVVRSVVAPTQRATAATALARPPYQQEDKLSQVTNSMEELRQLAVNVEKKIGVIKSRLITADDQNLDKILLSLRKFTPSAGPHSPDLEPGIMQDFYHNKKNKLEDALNELDRIYNTLDIDKDVMRVGAERRGYPSYGAKPVGTSSAVSSASGIGSAAGPSRYATSSSAYIYPLTVATVQAETSSSPYNHSQRGSSSSKVDIDKQAQSEFDVISKSFQAIIDEVNKTASLVSGASSSTPQPKPRKPLPEIKELQSKVYASKEQDVQRLVASPETARRPLNVTLISQQVTSSPGPTPKSPPPAVAPKPAFRAHASASQQPAFPSQQAVAGGVSMVASADQTPVTSVVRAEMARYAPEKREQRIRGRFRPKPPNQEKEEANRRARSKSSPTITLQDLQGHADSSDPQPTAKSQLNFQLEPAGPKGTSQKPPLQLDIARAQQGSMVELQLKPPVMFQDSDDTGESSSGKVVAQSIVLRQTVDSAPPPDGETVVFPETPTTTSAVSVSTASSATQPANMPAKADVSSSESSAEGREKKGKEKLGRGVAMMVELFSSSDEERLRRSHPLHTRSAPDLSADIPSDDAVSVPKNVSNIRPAELTRVMQHKSDTGSLQGSPATERKRGGHTPAAVSQSDSVGSPQSPSSKPPFHPFRRQQPSPDRVSESSPQRSTAVTELQAARADNVSAPENTATVSAASTVKDVTRARPANSKADGQEVSERPRSFHELLSTFEPNVQRLNNLRSQGKCASEEVLPEQVVVARVFRASSFTSEPDLRARRDSAPTPQEVRQWKL